MPLASPQTRTRGGDRKPSVIVFDVNETLIVLLYPLRPELILQSGQDFTRSMVVQPSLFASTQPACASAAERGRGVGVEMLLDQTRDQLA